MKKLEICSMEKINGGASWECIHALAGFVQAGHALKAAKTQYDIDWAMFDVGVAAVDVQNTCGAQQ